MNHRTPRTHRARVAGAAAAVAVAVAALSGCTAKVATTVEVTGAQAATLRVAATFTGEAGEVVAENPQARTGLVELFTARTGDRPEVEVTGDRVRLSTTVDYTELADLADVTGVRSITLTEAGGRTEVGYGPATRLRRVVAEQNASEPDADALTRTMLESTELELVVVYPGGVDRASADTAAPVVAGDTATLTRTAAETDAGTLTVTGDPDRGRWPWLAGGGAALLLAGWWLRRR